MELKDRFMHLHVCAAYMRWKVGKDFSEENENEIGRKKCRFEPRFFEGLFQIY